MSNDLEDVYRQLCEAWNEGDVDAIVAHMHEDVVIESLLTPVEGGYRGHDGVRRWWASFHEAFPDWRVELLDIRSAPSQTIAKIRLTGHGGGSGLPVDLTTWHDVRWRDDKMLRLLPHETQEEADAALGDGGDQAVF
jgi:hypothetical protein